MLSTASLFFLSIAQVRSTYERARWAVSVGGMEEFEVPTMVVIRQAEESEH